MPASVKCSTVASPSAPPPTKPFDTPGAVKLADANCFLPVDSVADADQDEPLNFSVGAILSYPPIDKHSVDEPKPLFC